MGCVVNGPGEAREADLGIAAGSKRGHLFVKGTVVTVVPEDEMVDALVEWAEFIDERRASRRALVARPTRARRPRPRPTGPRCSTSRATTPTRASSASTYPQARRR